MRCKALLVLFLFSFFQSWSQNPATIFSIPNRNLTLSCGTSCTTLTAVVPHIKQTNDYVATSIPYLPFAYTTAGGTEVNDIYNDDTWSGVINPGFPFCFYNITYNGLLMGSNSNITFDLSRAGAGSGYIIDPGDEIPLATSVNVYQAAAIFGPYHDINPSASNNPAPTARKVEWRVEGTAPSRRFIASYNDVRYFGSSCNSFSATHQMVLYESTGIIEVYIKDKPVCTSWNDGLAILGVQDETRTKAVAAPGKNATAWGTTNMNEAYRFTPSGGVSRFKNAVLLVNNAVVASADTTSGTPGNLNLSFPNVCPTADSTAYVLRLTYGSCSDPAQDAVYYDTVYIRRPVPTVTLSATNASCTAGGTITANVAGTGTYEFSLNGGAQQTANSFSNLAPGNYLVQVRGAGGGCAVTSNITVGISNTLSVSALPSDTSLCAGASFVPRVTGTSGATYSWTPGSDASNVGALQPTITPGALTTQVIVTATQGPCQVKDTIRISQFPGPQVNAGPDLTIVRGDQVQLLATAAAGSTYSWTPATALSAANVLRPIASPQQSTVYTLTATTPQGCTSSDALTVTVLNCIDVMNAFSPNGDGQNDRWLITNQGCFKAAHVRVFNRYGALVFEDRAYSNNWDGTYKGKPLADGTYYYIVRYELINSQLVEQKGNVTILR